MICVIALLANFLLFPVWKDFESPAVNQYPFHKGLFEKGESVCAQSAWKSKFLRADATQGLDRVVVLHGTGNRDWEDKESIKE